MKKLNYSVENEGSVLEKPNVEVEVDALLEVSKEGILVKAKSGRRHKILPDQIEWLSSQHNYTYIIKGNEKYCVPVQFGKLLKKLDCPALMRIHKCYAINTYKEFEQDGNRVFINKAEIPIGKTYKANFMKHFTKL